jgi:hypothetical protein
MKYKCFDVTYLEETGEFALYFRKKKDNYYDMDVFVFVLYLSGTDVVRAEHGFTTEEWLVIYHDPIFQKHLSFLIDRVRAFVTFFPARTFPSDKDIKLLWTTIDDSSHDKLIFRFSLLDDLFYFHLVQERRYPFAFIRMSGDFGDCFIQQNPSPVLEFNLNNYFTNLSEIIAKVNEHTTVRIKLLYF